MSRSICLRGHQQSLKGETEITQKSESGCGRLCHGRIFFSFQYNILSAYTCSNYNNKFKVLVGFGKEDKDGDHLVVRQWKMLAQTTSRKWDENPDLHTISVQCSLRISQFWTILGHNIGTERKDLIQNSCIWM